MRKIVIETTRRDLNKRRKRKTEKKVKERAREERSKTEKVKHKRDGMENKKAIDENCRVGWQKRRDMMEKKKNEGHTSLLFQVAGNPGVENGCEVDGPDREQREREKKRRNARKKTAAITRRTKR